MGAFVRTAFVGTVVACAFAAWVATSPAAGASPTDFSAQARAAERRAQRSLAATERAAPAGHFAYYTSGTAWKYSGPGGWAAGFVPGGLWACYQLSGNGWWAGKAATRQARIGASPITPESLNLGALFFPSYARGYRLTGDRRLRSKALQAARAMARRYDPVVGAMLSRPKGDFNVIADSLMKSQFLWWAADNGAPEGFAEIARQHALTIARDFVRPDGSTYHMVKYDVTNGDVLWKGQSAGYSDDSTWARGQAWAILGFSAAYRETGEQVFLDAARAVCDWYLANVPADMVPYWDFQAPDIPLAPRDSSAAAIASSGLLDLALTDPDGRHRARYAAAARATLASLASHAYSSFGAIPAVLLHGTYSWRNGTTDRGLAYGDTFFVDALLRLRRFAPDVAALPLVKARASVGIAASAIDGDLGSVWASRGRKCLDIRIAGTQEVGAVRVALRRGDERAAVLRILVSMDGRHWRLAEQTMTSGEWAGFETLDFAPRAARWVRLECRGTTLGSANRIADVEVYPAF